MPAPLAFIPAAAKAAAPVAGGMLLGATASAATMPWSRGAAYTANNQYPNMLVDTPGIIQLYYAGQLTAVEMTRQLRCQGIDTDGAGGVEETWRRFVDLQVPTFDLDTHKKWQRQGRIGYQQAASIADHFGFARTTDK